MGAARAPPLPPGPGFNPAGRRRGRLLGERSPRSCCGANAGKLGDFFPLGAFQLLSAGQGALRGLADEHELSPLPSPGFRVNGGNRAVTWTLQR